jgi:peptidoglycan hydrolase-like protein with peptidoglycan-binding domain
MSRLTDKQIATLARSVGFNGTGLRLAIAVCLAESAGNPHAVNTYGNKPPSRDRGLWQINDHYHPDVSDAVAFDPTGNARAAYRISSHGSNWHPWSTYNSGSYRQFLNRADAAIRAIGAAPQPAAGTYRLHRYLKRGCTGADVKALQAKVGCARDGIFGPITDQHVRTWQHEHRIATDGIVGPVTCRTLGWVWS